MGGRALRIGDGCGAGAPAVRYAASAGCCACCGGGARQPARQTPLVNPFPAVLNSNETAEVEQAVRATATSASEAEGDSEQGERRRRLHQELLGDGPGATAWREADTLLHPAGLEGEEGAVLAGERCDLRKAAFPASTQGPSLHGLPSDHRLHQRAPPLDPATTRKNLFLASLQAPWTSPRSRSAPRAAASSSQWWAGSCRHLWWMRPPCRPAQTPWARRAPCKQSCWRMMSSSGAQAD